MQQPFYKSWFKKLVKKFISGKANQKEEAFLENYYRHFEEADHDLSQLSVEEKEDIKNKMKERIWSTALSNNQTSRGKGILLHFIKKYPQIAVAASIAGVLLISALFLVRHPDVNAIADAVKLKTKPTAIAITPGQDKALLTLADGSVIMLDSAGNGLLTAQSNASVSNSNGKLVYSARQSDVKSTVFNTISTPRGGQYQIVLADGTKVWLNATSSLQYPVTFSGNERRVNLTGEAYFEVAKNKLKPFIVHVKDVDVKVLGTHFNIMSYDDEDHIATTLLEGSVDITKADISTVLFPGQQMRYYTDGRAELKENADIDQAIAWKNGKFYFVAADIKTIMRQLSRWYNVDVVYEGKIPDVAFGGIVSRKENINQLLKVFELTGKVHFKTEGTKITVMP